MYDTLKIASGIFLGLLAVRAVDLVIRSVIASRKRKALMGDMKEAAETFIDRMHAEMVAEREAQAAKPKRRAAVRKPVVKSKSVQRREAATKGAKNVRRTNR